MRYLLHWLTLVTLFCLTNQANAQPITKITFHEFDTVIDTWKPEHEIHWIYRNSEGTIDSVVRLKVLSPKLSTLERFYDWVHVTDEIDLKGLDGFDRSLRQTGYQGVIARRKNYFSLENNDTAFVEKKEIGVIDSLVVTHAETVFGSDGFFAIDSFFRDETGQVFKLRRIVAGAHYNEDRTTLKQLVRDQSGRVIQSVDKLRLFAEQSRDSILYEYNADNSLRTMYYYQLAGVPSIRKFEYAGWSRFESRRTPFKEGPVVGGGGYSSVNVLRWDEDSDRYVFSWSASQEFDENGRIIRDNGVTRSLLNGVWTDVIQYDTNTYYPNGDRHRESRWNSRYNNLIVEEFSNTYSGAGELLVSDYIYDGQPRTRTRFEYFTSDVKPGHLHNDASRSFGKVLSLTTYGTHDITVYNVLGIVSHETSSDNPTYELPLPSGLYFISIDGGKTRKHLIP